MHKIIVWHVLFFWGYNLCQTGLNLLNEIPVSLGQIAESPQIWQLKSNYGINEQVMDELLITWPFQRKLNYWTGDWLFAISTSL